MKQHGEYIPLTQMQINAAQHSDIIEYLRSRGEEIRRQGSRYI